jgi:hypothetical protein
MTKSPPGVSSLSEEEPPGVLEEEESPGLEEEEWCSEPPTSPPSRPMKPPTDMREERCDGD